MNQADLLKLNEPPNSFRMIATMGGIGILCALLIVFTYQFTLPVITKKKVEALNRAVFEVLPGTKTKRTFFITTGGRIVAKEEAGKGDKPLYAGYDEKNNLIGVAVEASGQGFQDVIHLIYGYSPQKQAITGIKVLESKETPGLGDRIEKDPDFLKNFKALDVTTTEDANSLKHKIVTVKHGKKEHPWQIEGITGATISSKAVGRILGQSTAQWIPVIFKDIDQLKGIQK